MRGYLQVSDTRFLHYVLVTSKSNPDKAPVVFWFNGGPGASSLLGLFFESGPYLVSNDGTKLVENVHSWNKYAHKVFLETPAGTGFSYVTDGNYTNNDDQITQENYKAIQVFYEKFPNLRCNGLYIAGSSFAGHYTSMLASTIVNNQKNYQINLKGLLIGNGLVNIETSMESDILYPYFHGFVEEREMKNFINKCCKGNLETCNIVDVYTDNNKTDCQDTIDNFANSISNANVNVYNIYSVLQRCDNKLTKIGKDFDPSPTACITEDARNNYMNNPKLLKALHIPIERNFTWRIGSDKVRQNYETTQDDMSPFITNVLNAKIPVLLYFGEADSVLSFISGQRFCERLGRRIKTPKTPWVFDKQTAGMKTEYEGGLTFITVFGAGHAVNGGVPERSLYFFKQMLDNKPI
uniref:Uncharacterized protein n=1 Tax=Meloidogyne enterolobii TaxID=390850 RepID=A0A6V7XCI0_MELEN|nr:unnamed protein product [Meloidogyne enterolobii]